MVCVHECVWCVCVGKHLLKGITWSEEVIVSSFYLRNFFFDVSVPDIRGTLLCFFVSLGPIKGWHEKDTALLLWS